MSTAAAGTKRKKIVRDGDARAGAEAPAKPDGVAEDMRLPDAPTVTKTIGALVSCMKLETQGWRPRGMHDASADPPTKEDVVYTLLPDCDKLHKTVDSLQRQDAATLLRNRAIRLACLLEVAAHAHRGYVPVFRRPSEPDPHNKTSPAACWQQHLNIQPGECSAPAPVRAATDALPCHAAAVNCPPSGDSPSCAVHGMQVECGSPVCCVNTRGSTPAVLCYVS